MRVPDASGLYLLNLALCDEIRTLVHDFFEQSFRGFKLLWCVGVRYDEKRLLQLGMQGDSLYLPCVRPSICKMSLGVFQFA